MFAGRAIDLKKERATKNDQCRMVGFNGFCPPKKRFFIPTLRVIIQYYSYYFKQFLKARSLHILSHILLIFFENLSQTKASNQN